MPPKMARNHQCDGQDCTICTRAWNPRVVLRPFLAPDSRYERNQYHFTSAPATAELFNKPEFSDLTLVVGEQQYSAHRLILCAASDVFAKMLGSDWSESHSRELVLHEDENCSGPIFQQFLFYMYSGSIMISEKEEQVVPLFMLADKYNVKQLYEECVKVIKNGLKVYVVHKMKSRRSAAGSKLFDSKHFAVLSSSSDSSSDSDSSVDHVTVPQPSTSNNHDNMLSQPPVLEKQQECEPSTSKSTESSNFALIASEAFHLNLVIKMLTMCQNDCIFQAALYNMEVRLGKQISHSDYAVWNDLEPDLLAQILSDDSFKCDEHVIFSAAKSWLSYSEDRKTAETVARVLTCLRYPLLSRLQLYKVKHDPIVLQCQPAMDLTYEAMTYKLFYDIVPTGEREQWTGAAFQPRKIRTQK